VDELRGTWPRRPGAALVAAALAVLVGGAGCAAEPAPAGTGATGRSPAGSVPYDMPSSAPAAEPAPEPEPPAPDPALAPVSVGLPPVVVPADVVLPDRARTPGAINLAVTQATIASTICVPGYTASIRPPASYTTNLKRQQLASGYTLNGDTDTADYEEDHRISLELGGDPSDARNLWPEPYAATGARVKDRIENKLHELVCAGSLPLAVAQADIATNWYAAYVKYLGPGTPQPGPSESAPPPAAAPAAALAPSGAYYANCAAARAAGAAPHRRGQPGYRPALDRDGDGIACE